MNQAQWRVYNREKQRLYRERKRGHVARPYNKVKDILEQAGHCPFCAMLLDSEYHKAHPLVGCLKAMHQ